MGLRPELLIFDNVDNVTTQLRSNTANTNNGPTLDYKYRILLLEIEMFPKYLILSRGKKGRSYFFYLHDIL